MSHATAGHSVCVRLQQSENCEKRPRDAHPPCPHVGRGARSVSSSSMRARFSASAPNRSRQRLCRFLRLFSSRLIFSSLHRRAALRRGSAQARRGNVSNAAADRPALINSARTVLRDFGLCWHIVWTVARLAACSERQTRCIVSEQHVAHCKTTSLVTTLRASLRASVS